jgi:hypothetical protein
MKRLVFLFLLLSCVDAQAQSSTRAQAQAVAACGGQSLTAGVFYPVTQDLTGTLCTASGGGGSTSVTQGTVPWVVSGQGTAGTAATGVVTVQGIASMTPILSTLSAETTKVIGTVNQGTSPWVISGSLTANQSVNVAQVAGTTAATGSGVLGAGTQRVALATDSPGVITPGPAAIANSIPTIPSSQYPGNNTAAAVPITASATGTTGATTATLAGVASKTTYLCGFSIRATATAAAVGNATVTGTVTGTLNFSQFTQALATGMVPLEPNIGSVCIPASATNTGIAVISAAPGTGGVVSVTAWGYQL